MRAVWFSRLDLLEMEPVPASTSSRGDFREGRCPPSVEEKLGGRQEVGLVVRHGPNMSGVNLVDQAAVMHLAELGLEFSNCAETGARSWSKFFRAGLRCLPENQCGNLLTVAVRKPEASATAVPSFICSGVRCAEVLFKMTLLRLRAA